jgi:hypothetical protein
MSKIQFQPGLSLNQFLENYGTILNPICFCFKNRFKRGSRKSKDY